MWTQTPAAAIAAAMRAVGSRASGLNTSLGPLTSVRSAVQHTAPHSAASAVDATTTSFTRDSVEGGLPPYNNTSSSGSNPATPEFPCVSRRDDRNTRLLRESLAQRHSRKVSAGAVQHQVAGDTVGREEPNKVQRAGLLRNLKWLSEPGVNTCSFMAKDVGSGARTESTTANTREPQDNDKDSGPEPSYSFESSGFKLYRYSSNSISRSENAEFKLYLGGTLADFNIAYETWGTLNEDKSNVILLMTGLSANSHAKSSIDNPRPGWWEKFIGPGRALDTNKFHIICVNVLGSCFGSTGPASSVNHIPTGGPGGELSSLDFKETTTILNLRNGAQSSIVEDSNVAKRLATPQDFNRYGARFPLVTIFDMVRSQFMLLDALGIKKLHAVVGSSMGAMQSLTAGILFPSRVGRLVAISGCIKSHPYSIALRHVQRQALLTDPNFRKGDYYGPGLVPPHNGLQLARQIGTITYRSGPEWEERFGRRRRNEDTPVTLCADFLIEHYLEHQGDKFCTTFDANSLLYISKAMDLFDLGKESVERARYLVSQDYDGGDSYESRNDREGGDESKSRWDPDQVSLIEGLKHAKDIPTLIIGVQSDLLFPVEQQRETAKLLRMSGNSNVAYTELDSQYGHDTFLIDLVNVGSGVKGWLELVEDPKDKNIVTY